MNAFIWEGFEPANPINTPMTTDCTSLLRDPYIANVIL